MRNLREMPPLRRLMFLGAMANAAGKLIEDTATGNPAVFETDVAKPLKSLIANFLPIQASGTPAPDNILPITGWTGLNVGHCGRNMFNGVRENGYISDNGVIGVDGYNYHSELIRVEVGEKYTYSLVKNNESSSNKRVHGYDINGDWVQLIKKEVVSQEGNISITFTVPNGVYFVRVQFYGAVADSGEDTDIQIEQGETATAYEPYNGTVYPVTLTEQGELYGGYVDLVTGEVWATYGEFVADGQDESWGSNEVGGKQRYSLQKSYLGDTKNSGKAFCDWLKQSSSEVWGGWIGSTGNFLCYAPLGEFEDVDAWKAHLAEHNLQIVFELASPVLITTLTPQQINAIKGNNTVWSDANGSMTAVYLKKA